VYREAIEGTVGAPLKVKNCRGKNQFIREQLSNLTGLKAQRNASKAHQICPTLSKTIIVSSALMTPISLNLRTFICDDNLPAFLDLHTSDAVYSASSANVGYLGFCHCYG